MPETTSTQQESINIPYTSPFAPDFLLFAFPLAALLDIFGVISIFISFGIAGIIVSFILGIFLVVWTIKKEGNIEAAKDRIKQLQNLRVSGGKGVKRAAERKILQRTVLRRMLTKGTLRLVVGSLLVFFPYWLWLVFSVLRKR